MDSSAKRASSLGLCVALGIALAAPASAACDWKLFPTANPEPSGNQLTAVAGTGPSDVWETGAAYHAHRSDGYALHWDGRAWESFAQGDPTRHGGQLSGVVAIAPNDVWTIGQRYAATNYSGRAAVAEHWNGRAFTEAALPAVGTAETFLYAALAGAPNDVWSVGGSLAAGGLQQTYVVHFDGTAWTQIPAPDVPNRATNLDSIARTGPQDMWAVGGFRTSTSAPFRTLAEHWDGTGWSIVPTPDVNGRSNVFNAVVAVAPDDAWAVGDYDNGKAFAPLAEHWDGRSWTVVPTPRTGAHTTFIIGAAAVSKNEAFAVGEIARGGGAVASYILRWDGTRWFEAPSPNVAHRLVTLFNAAAAIPGGGVWAVGGDANAKIVVHTVTAVRSCVRETSGARR